MSEDPARLLARLAHDVGKYVARSARNVRSDDVPRVLVDMLARDLYELADGRRASVVFAERAAALRALDDGRLERVGALLAEADSLETELRGGEAVAVRRGAEIALEVEGLLRAAAADAGGRS